MNGSEWSAEGEAGCPGDALSGLEGEAAGEVVRDKGVEGGAGILYSSKNLRRTAGLRSAIAGEAGCTHMGLSMPIAARPPHPRRRRPVLTMRNGFCSRRSPPGMGNLAST